MQRHIFDEELSSRLQLLSPEPVIRFRLVTAVAYLCNVDHACLIRRIVVPLLTPHAVIRRLTLPDARCKHGALAWRRLHLFPPQLIFAGTNDG